MSATETLLSVGGMPDTVTEPLTQLLGWASWLACLGAVGRLIWIGAEFGHAKQTGDGSPETPVWVLIGVIVVSASSGIAAALLS